MSTSVRSKRGCWTCRIRKKKCDENTPECTACKTLDIKCHVFNQKPDWMDGGGREREGALEIKLSVKASLNRRAVLRSASRRQTRSRGGQALGLSSQEPSLSTPGTSAASSASDHGDAGDIPQYDKPSQSITPSPAPTSIRKETAPPRGPSDTHDLAVLIQPPFTEEDDSYSAGTLQDHRARLLMHFLDHVFPLEFPFYNPSMFEGGRGWILSLLMRTKPLYHAALSISAYHHTALNQARNTKCKIDTWTELQIHHTLALQELHQDMRELDHSEAESNINGRIDALASIVQMISFELFVGGAEIWKTHLQAAMALFTGLMGPAATCKQSWYAITNVATRQDPNQYSANQRAVIFLSAVLIWFDILACVSTGSAPVLQEYHPTFLTGIEPLIQLDGVMGCSSEVMMIIAQIAGLEAWKKESKAQGKLSNIKLVTRATSIETDLEAVASKLADVMSRSPSDSCEVTQLFASAALVYLHVVVSGFQFSLPEIRSTVAKSITMFQHLSNPKLLRSLVWPLCVTGCLATKEQEGFFRDLVMGMSMEAYMFGSIRSALRIMENSWEKRDGLEEGWDWAACMNSLGHLMLIV